MIECHDMYIIDVCIKSQAFAGRSTVVEHCGWSSTVIGQAAPLHS